VNDDQPDSDLLLLMGEILRHLVVNPDAKDSVEGIHNFWLSQPVRHASGEKVRAALDYLVDTKSWLTRKPSSAAVTFYGLDKDRIDEINQFLGARQNSP